MTEKNKKTCPICKKEHVSFMFEVGGFDVDMCGDCSTAFVRDMPNEQTLKLYYDNADWFEKGLKGGYSSYDVQTEDTLPFVESLLDSLDKKADYKSILDIGCGYGTHLGLAYERGWQCFGLELSDHARNIAIERHGDYAFIKRDVGELFPHRFDVILLLDVIEHLPDPYPLFYTLFAKGAIDSETVVVITTPNAQSWDAGQKREQWEYMHPPSHLIYYSAESLFRFLDQLRFKHIDISGQYSTNKSHSINDDSAFPRNAVVADYVGLVVQASGSDFTQFMQERYVPGTWSVLAEYEHMPRYLLAQKFTANKKVLDFGCGTGYGSKLLADIALNVVALDVDEEALRWACMNHQADNLEFIHRDNLGADIDSGTFDLIVNFEMIEHVDQNTQHRCLEQFSRLLKNDGILLISTPNPSVTAEYGENPYHIHEMEEDEFHVFLKSQFRYVVLLEQFISPSVSIKRAGVIESDSITVGEQRPVAYIAIASHAPIGDIYGLEYKDFSYDFVSITLNNTRAIEKLEEKNYQFFLRMKAENTTIQTQSSQIAELQQVVEAKDSAIQTQSSQIAELQQVVEAKDSAIQTQSSQIAELQQVLEAKDSAIQTQSSQIAELQQVLEAKNSAIQMQSSQIAELQQVLEAKDSAIQTQSSQIAELQQVLEAKNSAIQTQSSQRAELERVFNDNIQALELSRGNEHTLRLEVKYLTEELTQLRNTRSHRLAHAWHHDRRSLRKLFRLLKIIVGAFVPLSYRAKIGQWMIKKPSATTVVMPLVPSKKRVLHVIANFFLGGSSRLVADIVYASSDCYQHQVVTSAAPTPAVYLDIPVHVYPMGFNPQELAPLINEFNPDLVHIHYWGDCDEPWYAAVYALIEDRSCHIIENINTPVAPYIGSAIDRYVYVSDYVKHNFPADANKSLTIYPGSDFDLFRRENVIEVPDDCIGMVYRLENDKLNIASIQPFIETVKKRPQTKVIIVGGGTNFEAYQKACDDAGVLSSFTFTGYVPYETLPDWYRQFSIFVAPVWKESFGQVSPFAMSMGIPVVGYNIGAISEIIGRHDLLANAGDAQQLSEIIIDLLDDRKQRLEIGEYNRQRAIELFSVQAMTNAYRDLYGEVLGNQA